MLAFKAICSSNAEVLDEMFGEYKLGRLDEMDAVSISSITVVLGLSPVKMMYNVLALR